MHFDDAFDFLVERLAAVPDLTGPMGRNARNTTYGNDVWITKIAEAYWQPRMPPGPLVKLEVVDCSGSRRAAWMGNHLG